MSIQMMPEPSSDIQANAQWLECYTDVFEWLVDESNSAIQIACAFRLKRYEEELRPFIFNQLWDAALAAAIQVGYEPPPPLR